MKWIKIRFRSFMLARRVDANGSFIATGGRVLGVTAAAEDLLDCAWIFVTSRSERFTGRECNFGVISDVQRRRALKRCLCGRLLIVLLYSKLSFRRN